MSCGVTVQEDGAKSKLVSYRFDYRFADSADYSVFRFDLRSESHAFPLMEPRAHLHLAVETTRIPTILISPFEVLDYLFYVVDPQAGNYKPS